MKELFSKFDELKSDQADFRDNFVNVHEKTIQALTDLTMSMAKKVSEELVPMMEKCESAIQQQGEYIDKLFDLSDQRKAECAENARLNNLVHCKVAAQGDDIGVLKTTVATLQQELSALKTRQSVAEEKSDLIQSTQHDDYDKAFIKEDFQKVFLFLITYGYNTVTGQTCVVFQEVNGVLCVCVNLRALNLIAKLKLNYSQVTKSAKFPAFGLFKLNSLRQLFREVKLPQMELNKTDLENLSKHLGMRPLKTPAGNKTSWIALEADPFVLAIKNLRRAKKIEPFMTVFDKYYPKSIKLKKLTEKDMCYFLQCKDQPEGLKQPLFLVPYWRELFYTSMKEYRKRFVEEGAEEQEHVRGHAHFSSLCSVDLEEEILSRDVVLEVQEQARVEEEENQSKKRKRSGKSAMPTAHEERESDEEQDSDEEHVFQKRQR